MKKVLSLLLCLVLLLSAIPTVSALTEDEANAGYYLVGTMNDWQVSLQYRLDQEPADASEYRITNLPLSTTDAFKVVYSPNGRDIVEWYPAGTGNNCTIGSQGVYNDSFVDIRFRPNMDGDESWFFGCIRLQARETPVDPTELTEPDEIDGGYYVVFKGDNYRIHERNRMHRGLRSYVAHGLTMSISTPFKIAYSLDLQTVSKLYPEGEGNDYVPRYNSRYYTVEFNPLGDNEGDSSDMAWYDGYVSAYPCEPPEEGGGALVPAPDIEMKRNLFEDDFFNSHPFCDPELYDYNEVYYHGFEWADYEWVLVQVIPVYTVDGFAYGVFDDAILYNAESYPFDFTYGVYDVYKKTYYSITEAWDMGFTDLHDVFNHIVRTRDYARQLGDVDSDDELSIIDATLIQRSMVGLYDRDQYDPMFERYTCKFGTKLTSLADYDADGEVDVIDVTYIQRALVGIELYPHDFTLSAQIDRDDPAAIAKAFTSFGEEPVQYCYRIEGSVYAASVYGDDFGKFYPDNVNPEPGNFQITTGWISDSSVELPLTSLTYYDNLTLKVQARDAYGNEAQTAVLYFRNVY